MKDLFGHDKIKEVIERLIMFEPPEGYYGATSWGKDSLILMFCANNAGLKKPVEWHFNMTTIDPPELIYFGREMTVKMKGQGISVIWNRPPRPFLAVLPERGFPTRRNRWCCQVFKESGGSGRRVLTGIRAAESTKRAGRKVVEQCYRDSSLTYVNPILDWSDNDVWNFIKERNIPYCSLYDEGFKRIGCVMCPMSSRQVREGDRWPRMKEAFRRAFIKLYENRGDRPAFKRWKDGSEMFEWWLHDTKESFNPDQTVMFE